MSDIIKNIFNDNNSPKHVKASKYCGICQEAFSRDRKDNFKLDYCAECTTTDKISAVAHWKSHFAQQRVNSLPPYLAALSNKLKNNALIEGTKLARVNENMGAQRSLKDIVSEQAQTAPSFETTRNQIANLLPTILNEMGLTNKVDAELLLDTIVPTKIASPIVNTAVANNVLRQVVAETLSHLNMDKALDKETLIKPHGKVAAQLEPQMLLNEGYRRVSNDYGNHTRRVANPLNQMQMGEPDADMPVGSADTMGDFAPPMDDENSASNGEVVHLPEDEANQLIQEKSNPDQGAMTPPPDNMLNEGIGTYSGGGEGQVPDASDAEELPHENQVKRIESSVSDFISRRIQEKKAAVKRPPAAELLSVAGKLQTAMPVQIVHLAQKDRNVIEAYPPLNFATAAYSDGTQKTFKCYATDRGYFYINDDFSVHSNNGSKFAEFISSDPSFVKWAFLPPDVDEKNVMAPDHDVEDMALPEMSSDAQNEMGDPGFNEIKETHLNSSPNNQIGSGLGDDPQAIFDNGNPGMASSEDALVDSATELMPRIEKMFPDKSPEEHQNMAISAALYMMEDQNLKKKSNDLATELLSKVKNPVFEDKSPVQSAGYGKGFGLFERDPEHEVSSNHSHQQMPLAKVKQSPSSLSKLPLEPEDSQETPKALAPPVPPLALAPKKEPLALSTALLNKAASLMPYINDTYSKESESTRLTLAINSARNLMKIAESPEEMPAMPEAPHALPPMAKRKERAQNQTIGNAASVDAITPFHSQQAMEQLKHLHPDFAAAAQNPEAAHSKFQEIARGGYGGRPLDFSSTDVSRASNKNKAIDKYIAQLHSHLSGTEDENSAFPGVKKRLGDRIDTMMSGLNTEQIKNVLQRSKPGEDTDAPPKEKNPFPVTYPRSPEEIAEIQKSRSEQGGKPVIPNKFKSFQPVAAKAQELMTLTADMNTEEFELSAEALMDMGYSDNDIMSVFAALQKKAEGEDDVNGSTSAVFDSATKSDPKTELPKNHKKLEERMDGLRDWEDDDDQK